MVKETRYIKRVLKNNLFKKHKNILEIIYYIGNRIMLKDQLKAIESILEPLCINLETDIKELIDYGFLKEKKVVASNKKALYLTSFPISKIEGVPSRNVSCVNPTTEKILMSLLKTEYLLNMILEDNNFTTFADSESWLQILETKGNTLLIEKSNATEVYKLIENMEELESYLREDFYIDRDVCNLEKDKDFNNKSKVKVNLKQNEIESLAKLNQEKLAYSNTNRASEKYFFNFKMFLGRNFILEKIVDKDKYTISINIACMDFENDLKVEKLFLNIGFVYIMFKRYLNKNIELNVDAYTWSVLRVRKLQDNETEKVKELGANNFKKYTKGLNALYNAGVLETDFKNIKVTYKDLNIPEKYNINKE